MADPNAIELRLKIPVLVWYKDAPSLDPNILSGNPYNLKKEKEEILESNFDKLVLKTLSEV